MSPRSIALIGLIIVSAFVSILTLGEGNLSALQVKDPPPITKTTIDAVIPTEVVDGAGNPFRSR